MQCKVVTQNGLQCDSILKSSNSSALCEHHAQINRFLKLAGKPGLTTIESPGTRVSPIALKSPQKSNSPRGVVELNIIQQMESFTYLYPNEVQTGSIRCSFVVHGDSVAGSLSITNYRLRFMCADRNRHNGKYPILRDAMAGIPLACVRKVGYPMGNGKSSENALPTELMVWFKDLRRWVLKGEIGRMMSLIQSKLIVNSPVSLFAFVKGNGVQDAGHGIYDVRTDFLRMGIDFTRDGRFRICDLNKDYTLCPTYPPQIVVPASMSDSSVKAVASFRSKGRMPMLCWVHGNGASIWRCAQPKRGILNAQCHEDTEMLALIGNSNPNQSHVWIVDARPELNARANNFTGGGTESASIRHAKVSFMNIANIHVMRDSLKSVCNLVQSTSNDLNYHWLGKVEDTKWLYHVRNVLSAAAKIAIAINSTGQTVIVHCSDGWDRTAQLCSLSQMLLDPNYRSLAGFMEIIEKEWIRAGHKFNDRIGPGMAEHDQQSPVFLQFLDCCWQLLQMYPTWFEFNNRMLIYVADSLFSGQFGTFLCDCDRERTTLQLRARTRSLWTSILDNRSLFANPFYRQSAVECFPLLPEESVILRNVRLWHEFYCRSTASATVSAGNPIPPLWLESKWKTPQSSTEDMEQTLLSYKARIEKLEQQLVVNNKNTTCSKALNVAPPPAPPVPSVIPRSAQSTTKNIPNDSSGWSCSLCTKKNASGDVKCVICGRNRR